jgi:hypothetical protein
MTNTRSSVAVGFAYFAAIMMMVVGVVDILQGISAIVKDHYYVVGAQYLYKVDVTAWGWIHLILGIVLGVSGFFLLNGAVWARIVGIITASLVIIANFMWLPYYPVWAIIVIAASVLVIWALTMHGREIAG